MKPLSATGYLLAIFLVLLGCSQQVPVSDSPHPSTSQPPSTDKGPDPLTDVVVHSLASVSTEVRYEKPRLFILSEPYQGYHYVLVLGLGSDVMRLGFLKDLSRPVEWFEPVTPDVEQCLMSQNPVLSDLILGGENGVEAQVASLSSEIQILCGLSDASVQVWMFLVGNTIFLPQLISASHQTRAGPLELDSTVVSVLGSTLMIHVDDRNNPSFAMIHRYVDEIPVTLGDQHTKRLRTEFSLKNLKAPSKVLFDSEGSKIQEIIPDPLQSGCSAVRADWEGEPIYISFKQIPDNHVALLGDLCGVYFSRSKKLYTADTVLGSFIDI